MGGCCGILRVFSLFRMGGFGVRVLVRVRWVCVRTWGWRLHAFSGWIALGVCLWFPRVEATRQTLLVNHGLKLARCLVGVVRVGDSGWIWEALVGLGVDFGCGFWVWILGCGLGGFHVSSSPKSRSEPDRHRACVWLHRGPLDLLDLRGTREAHGSGPPRPPRRGQSLCSTQAP